MKINLKSSVAAVLIMLSMPYAFAADAGPLCFVPAQKIQPRTSVRFPSRVCVDQVSVELVPMAGYVILKGVRSDIHIESRAKLIMLRRLGDEVEVLANLLSDYANDEFAGREEANLWIGFRIDETGRISSPLTVSGNLGYHPDESSPIYTAVPYRQE